MGVDGRTDEDGDITMKVLGMSNSEKALLFLAYMNPLRNDGHAYQLELALWGLGLADFPIATDYGQEAPTHEQLQSYLDSETDDSDEELTPCR